MSKPERKATANLKRTVKQTVTTLRKLVRETRDTLSGIAKDAAKSGKTATEPGRQPVYAKIDEAVRVKLTERMNEALAVVCGKAADAGNEAAAEAIGDATVRYDSQYLKDYAERLTKGNESSIAAVYTTNISAGARRAMRAAAIDTFIAAAASGMTARERARLFMQTWEARTAEGAPEDVMGFVDRRGRRWRPDIYTQMLVRTTAQRVETASFCDSMLDGGFPLARISNDSHGNDCDVCARWSGKLIDLSSGHRFRSYAASLQEAREAGVFHPNCTHRLEFVPMSEYPEGALKLAKKGGLGEKGAFGQASGQKLAGIESDAERKRKIKAQQEAEAKRAAEEQARREMEAAKWEQILWGRDTDDDEAREMRREHIDHIRDAVHSGEGEYVGGSTGARLIVVDGRKYIVKRTRDGEAHGQLASEMAADEAYRAAGVDVPRFMRIVDPEDKDSGKPVVCKVSEFIEDAQTVGSWWKTAGAKEREQMKRKLQATFDIDAMLGNWDVFGESGDNILIDKNGKPWHIDNGGSLSYRAQGAKKDSVFWDEGWPDDFYSMLEPNPRGKRNFNFPYIEGITTNELLMQSGKRDWAPVLAKLNAEDRRIMEKRIEQVQKLAARADDFLVKGGYTEQYTDEVMRASYALTKEGYDKEVPKTITDGEYGFCRDISRMPPQYLNYNLSQKGKPGTGTLPTEPKKPAVPDVKDVTIAAVKTVNFHLGKGDTNFNQTTLDAFYKLEPALNAIVASKSTAANKSAAKQYLQVMADVKDAVASGKPVPHFAPPKITIITEALKTMPEFVQYDKDHKAWDKQVKAIKAQQKKAAAQGGAPQSMYASLTHHIYDYMRNNGGDPEVVRGWCTAQGGGSWDSGALVKKVVQMWARGENPTPPPESKGVFYGPTASCKSEMAKLAKSLMADPAKKEKVVKSIAQYHAATQLLLENADFTGNNKDKREVILFRTEKEKIIPGLLSGKRKVGDKIDIDVGPAESYSIFRTVVVAGSCGTIMRVPYSRIGATYFLDKTESPKKPEEMQVFLGDGENEFNADTHGIERVYVGSVPAGLQASDFYSSLK